ncbi:MULTISPECIES: hypothetical protein [Lactococcus]|uniref:hypothetical protein n=1 Tax=Lactococcus TaxID=1357 RepID=UPI000C7D9386|nr:MULTISPECIES: hypothetical protein [Lactococcus]WMB98817.1 hypothetical protein LLJM4_02750 [Lactococcus cremoris]
MIDNMNESIDHFENYKVKILKEGVGICGVHHCNLWQAETEVLSYPDELKKSMQREYKPHFCPMCRNEVRDRKLVELGALPEYGTDVSKPQEIDYFEKLRLQKGIDLKKDVIVKYNYSDELSVVAADNFVDWIIDNLAQTVKVKNIRPDKYTEQRRNRYMSDEEKQKFLKLKFDIETADILILNSLADFADKELEDVNAMLLSTKDTCAIIILTIPESDYRMEQLPIRLRNRFKRSQVMDISSIGAKR